LLVDFERFHGLWVGGVFIDVDHARRDAVRGTERFLKEGLGGCRVPFGAKEELDGLPVAIDGPILIQPFPFDLDIRFVHFPRVVGRLQLWLDPLFQFWRVGQHPSRDRTVINPHAALHQHFFQIPIAQAVA